MCAYAFVEEDRLPVVALLEECQLCDLEVQAEWWQSRRCNVPYKKSPQGNVERKQNRDWMRTYYNEVEKEKRHVLKYIGTKAACIPFSVFPFPDKSNVDADEFDRLVGDFAKMRLRSMGIFPFWRDLAPLVGTSFVSADTSLSGVMSFPDFHTRYLDNSLTHRPPMTWTVPEEATVMAFVPPLLLDSIMWDLKAVNGMGITWKSFSGQASNITHAEVPRQGKYRWFTPRSKCRKNEKAFLSHRTEALLNEFKQKFVLHVCPEMEEMDARKWKIYAGAVFTAGDATFQDAHCDFPESIQRVTWLLHMPLQSEGSLISIWDEHNVEHMYVHTPFGTFLATRADVWHSGFFGNPGNVRFHVIISEMELPSPNELYVCTDLEKQYQLNAARPRCYKEFLDVHHRQSMDFLRAITEVLCRRNQNKLYYSLENIPVKFLKTSAGGAVNQHPLPIPDTPLLLCADI